MGFVQTGFLGALGALAIPIVVHLIFRRRTRRVDLGTLRFLRIVLKENARRKKVKRWLLLALRMACVALLALLFARPYLVAFELSGENDRFVAILIDRSASMELADEQGSLLDQAVAEAKKILQSAGEGTQIELAFFDHTVHPIGGDVSHGGNATGHDSQSKTSLMELSAPETTFAATNYGPALAWARDLCVKSSRQRKEIHVLTDLQRSGLDWSGAEPMPPDVDVRLHALGRSAVNNVAVTGARLARSLVRPGETITVSATIFNSGPFPLEKIPVTLRLQNGDRTHTRREQVSLEPGSIQELEFEIAELGAGLWQGTVEIDVEDELRFDNRRHLAVMAAPQLKVLLLDGDPHPQPLLSETYFLEAALRLASPGETFPDSPYEPERVPFSENAALPELKQVDLVVLANVQSVSTADARRLGRFVEQGGGLLVFTGENVQQDGYRALSAAGLTVGAMTGTAVANDLPWRLESWDKDHSLFEPFNDPQHGDLRRLAFRALTRIEPNDGAHVLATFRGGVPAVVEKQHGKGKVLWFLSACDREWSDWTRGRLFLPLVHQMLGYLSGLTDGGPVRNVQIDSAESQRRDRVPGVHKNEGFWEVVNVNPRESETDRCTKEEFANRFGINLHQSEQPLRAGVDVKAALTMELRDDEIWHWVIFGLIGMLFVESLVANRTAA